MPKYLELESPMRSLFTRATVRLLLMPLSLMLWLRPQPAVAFIYPVNEIVRDVFANRKPISGLLVKLRHEIQIRESETISVDETILQEGGTTWFRWQPAGAAHPAISARASGNRYVFTSGGPEMALVSQTWLRYMVGGTAQDFLDTSLREGFVRREQLLQFTPGYKPEDDPKTWETNQNYLRHPDIFLHLVDGQPAISVVGTHEGERWRAIFFDLRRTGVRRLEWKNGNDTISWTFNRFVPAGNLGRFARELTLNLNGVPRIQTKVQVVQAVGIRDIPKEKREIQAAAATASGTSASGSSLDAALKVLLRYR